MLRSIVLATLGAALSGGCITHYYVSGVFQHEGVVYVQRCRTTSNNFSGSECWFERAPELPPSALVAPPPYAPEGAPGAPPAATPPVASASR